MSNISKGILSAAFLIVVCGLELTAAAAEHDKLAAMRRDVNPTALRHMITDLRQAHPGEFTRADEFLVRLADQERKLADVDALLTGTPTAGELKRVRETLDDALALQREIAFANPLLAGQPILYVVREQYLSDHHNTATLFHTGEPNCSKYRPGGALKVLDPKTGRVSVLLDPGPEGLVRDPEVHFDGHRVIFSMRKARDENYSIYELEVDPQNGYAAVPGSLRRLTAESEATDIDPVYLPDEKIVFSSTRDRKYCHCNMHIMANLFRMDADGANIHQIGKSTLFEGHSSLLPDGRLLYYRWEYVDRNYGDAQGLWTVNTDGTNHAVFWGNNTVSPAAVFDGRVIPGTEDVVCVFGCCHDRPWGALAIVDRGEGIDSKEAVQRIWPESARKLISIDGSDLPSPFMPDHFLRVRSRYEDPYPLVDPTTGTGGKYFLVSRSVDSVPSDQPIRRSSDLDALTMGIYLVDTFGNEILLHTEKPGCFDPMPLAPHPRPPVIPDRRDYRSPTGTMYVTDVYNGPAMRGVKRGTVAALRVVESQEKRFWTGPLWRCAQFKTDRAAGDTLNRPAISWAGFEVKQILGTVPVEEDGSVYFEVSADRFVYFQLLDREGMLVATMRSGTMVQPGEALSCAGCHESRLDAPVPSNMTLAFRRPPSKMDGWYGPARPFNYVRDIQPIWDKHCVRCHDFGKTAGERLVLAGDKELVFNASYVELFQNWGGKEALINTVGLGLAPVNSAYSIGSHQSQLVKLLKRGHEDIKLSKEEMDRIVTWIDIGGPYYPDYGCAHPNNVAGRAPLTIAQAKRLGELTSVQLVDDRGNPGWPSHRLWISFDRPELSPCLEKLETDSDAYQEALALIRSGQAELRNNPEADAPGFRYCEEHQTRDAQYRALCQRETVRRQALSKGEKVYDPGLPASVTHGRNAAKK